MSSQYARALTVVILIPIALGSSAMAIQAPPAGAAAGQGNLSLNIAQMITPIKGQAYRFSLCLGRLLAPTEISAPCRTAEATASKTVSGVAENTVIGFKLQNTSFLPPGFHLDGFGVITGTSDADVSKLNVRICAFQIGGIGSNFNCQGQPVGFDGGLTAQLVNPAPTLLSAAPAAGGGFPTGAVAGLAVLGAGTAAAVVYGPQLFNSLSGPDCSSQETAATGTLTGLANATNAFAQCGGNVSCINTRMPAVNNALSRMFSALGDWCDCLGPDAAAELTAEEKRAFQDAIAGLRAEGINAGSLPACFR